MRAGVRQGDGAPCRDAAGLCPPRRGSAWRRQPGWPQPGFAHGVLTRGVGAAAQASLPCCYHGLPSPRLTCAREKPVKMATAMMMQGMMADL